ncbi:MAG: hypothetical protein QW757_04010 [Candidatus Woesearchaeota archaeon]
MNNSLSEEQRNLLKKLSEYKVVYVENIEGKGLKKEGLDRLAKLLSKKELKEHQRERLLRFMNSYGIRPVIPLTARFVYTYGTYEESEKIKEALLAKNPTISEIADQISPLVYLVLSSACNALNGIDKKKDVLKQQKKPLEAILEEEQVPNLFVEPEISIEGNLDINSIAESAKEQYVNYISLLRNYFSGKRLTKTETERKKFEEIDEILKRYKIKKRDLKKELNNGNGENLSLVLDKLYRIHLSLINSSNDPRTQSLFDTLVYYQFRYLIGYDQGKEDIVVVSLDLAGMKHNNEKGPGPLENDELLKALSRAFTKRTRRKDFGFRYHGSGGDEFIMIFYFNRNSSENRTKNPLYPSENRQELDDIIKNRVSEILKEGLKNQLDYISEQIKCGRYIILE